ncbi:MAG: hypothetical protein HN875_04285 [Candidatus Nitrosopelagicus sp.]|nr:hypothetical protein [Candidatus Nitrosopelagicus sp.]
MKLTIFLILGIFAVGIVLIPLADAASNGKITIKQDSKSIRSVESTSFEGKFTDSQGYAMSYQSITLWENKLVNSSYEWKKIASGKTDARGNYKIKIDGGFWSHGQDVTVIAFSSKYDIRSNHVTISIEKPYSYEIKQQTNNNAQQLKSKKTISTQLFLETRGEPERGYWEIKPTVQRSDGYTNYAQVKFFVNNQLIGTIFTGNWLVVVNTESSSMLVTAKYDGGGLTEKFAPSTSTVWIDPIKKTTVAKKTTTTQKSKIDFKDASYKIKSKYYDIQKELEAGVKLSEKSLSGISFDNSDAKTKIDSAWKIRYMIWGYIDKGKSILEQSESYLKDKNYQKAWSKLHEFDTQLFKAHNHISAIAIELKEAKEIEEKYQEKNKSCVFGWCNTKDTTKGLDVKIKDLELKVEKIKNKEKDIKFLYQSSIQNKKFDEQEYQSTQEQERILIEKEIEKITSQTKQKTLENEKRQSDIIAKEKQQRLEEQRQREYEKELQQQERIRLQEQREYEEELLLQQIQAEQERQRLEEQKQRELQEQRRQAEQERQRLEEQRRQAEQERQRLEEQRQVEKQKTKIRLQAEKYPLIKGWMNGGLTYYVPTIPHYVSENVKNNIENLASWMDGKYFNGNKLTRVYSGNADIIVKWAKDWQGGTIGEWLYGRTIVVSLGTSGCDGQWKPFSSTTVYNLMYHEMGHALGQWHNSNSNHVMYKTIQNLKLEYDYDESIILIDGTVQRKSICMDGTYSFVTKKTGSNNGYKTYVIPPNTNALDVINGKSPFYTTCSSYKDEMASTSSQCYVTAGSVLLLHNPSVFGKGSDIPIDIKITNISTPKKVDYSFNSDNRQFDDEYFSYVQKLFR